ncbi:MAG TPA: GreA/GreB family elongation factor [Luteolibacter sp.]|nr:GreA/GreB family elongation factor [Luteolibacter sp.]
MNSFLLNEADFSRLHGIYHNESSPPLPSPDQRRQIGRILTAAEVFPETTRLEGHAGFNDEVVLASLADEKDDFVFRVVMPAEADPAEDRVSVLTPVSLAVIGRGIGTVVAWEANGGLREMKIVSINKTPSPDVAGVP